MSSLWLERHAAFHGKKSILPTVQLYAGLSDEDSAEFCNVSLATYRRWRKGDANLTGLRLMAIRAGFFPWPGWDRWFMLSGRLVSLDWQNFSMSPGELTAMPLRLQRLEEMTSELRSLREAYERLQGSISGEASPGLAEPARRQLR